jgi:membrane-bound ClpP family serine protease
VFIVYSSHVAAMAPNTTIGSSEVLIQGGEETDNGTPESGDAAALRRKATNCSFADTQPGRRSRAETPIWRAAVRESANLARRLLDQKVVECGAPTWPILLDR